MIPTVSICIPTFELGGRAISMLTKLFETIEFQSYKDFEVIISDHSKNDVVRTLCDEWKSRLPILFVQNEKSRGSCEANLNNAINVSHGKYIKPMLQDDFFLTPYALERLIGALKKDIDWSAGGCLHCREDDIQNLFHPHSPRWINDRSLALGQNRIGSPSVILYPRNVQNLYFDENLLWLMDCELYYRLGLEIGSPQCVADFLHVIRFRHDSISDSGVNDDIKGEEYHYVIAKMDQSGRTLDEFPLMYKRAQELQLNERLY